MRRAKALLAAGVAAFLLFLVAFLPASLLLRFLPQQVTLDNLQGSVWRGAASGMRVDGRPLGTLRWSSRPWRLAMLELDYGLQWQPVGGEVFLDLRTRGDGRVELRNIGGQLPLATLAGIAAPTGWSGTIELEVASLVLRRGVPDSAAGTVTLRRLTAPGPYGVDIGSFQLILGEGAADVSGIAGRLRDAGDGPMRVRGTLEVRPDRSWLVSGEVTALADAGPAVLETLVFLGPPDALGRRPFAFEGTF